MLGTSSRDVTTMVSIPEYRCLFAVILQCLSTADGAASGNVVADNLYVYKPVELAEL